MGPAAEAVTPPDRVPARVNDRHPLGNSSGHALAHPILVIIAVLGVVLPAAVWWLASRQASARPPYSRARRDVFGALMDPVDAWLVDHAELPSLQRLSVRTAVFGGDAVHDESLRPVARRLAAELLSGGLRSQVGGWSWLVLAAVGAAEVLAFAALWLVSGHPQARFASLVFSGVFALSMGLLRPRLVRHRLERAMRLNA